MFPHQPARLQQHASPERDDEDTDSLEGLVQSVTEMVRDDHDDASLHRPTSAPPVLPSLPTTVLSFAGGPMWAHTSASAASDFYSSQAMQQQQLHQHQQQQQQQQQQHVHNDWPAAAFALSLSTPVSPSSVRSEHWQAGAHQPLPPLPQHHHHAHSHSLGNYASFGHGSLPPPTATRDSTPRSTPPLSEDTGSPNEAGEEDEEDKLVKKIEELQRRLTKVRAGKLASPPLPPPQQQQQQQSPAAAMATPKQQAAAMHSADAPLELFVGRFLELATEQSGCRFLQQRVAVEGQQGAALVLYELLPQLNVLMVDAFGNYLYQILVQHVSAEQRLDMLERVRANLLRASLNIHGTRSVQKHIEFGGKLAREREIIVGELGAHVSQLARDTNGNHVVQRLLQSISHPDFVINAVVQDLIVVTRHRHGCSVVQRCIDAANAQQRAALMDKIVTNSVGLCQDPFANYVVQYVMDAGTSEERARLVSQIRGRMLLLSKHKCSSNVVEKALVLASASLPSVFSDLVAEALPLMGDLLNDSFANFVCQRMIETCKSDDQARLIVDAVRPHLERINPSTARRVADKILRRLPEMQRDRVVQAAASGPPQQFRQGPPVMLAGGGQVGLGMAQQHQQLGGAQARR
jgi:hypothetical protein